MSEKKSSNKINTSNQTHSNKYDAYTSKGADLHQAHSEYAEYHEANHHSFFNMNNAAGLFKLCVIGAIILIVIVALSPLFKLFKGLVGAGNAALGFFADLLHMCETNGACIPTNPAATPNPKAGVPGTCDGKGSVASKTPCQGWPQASSQNQPAPPAPCGQVVSTLCKGLLLGWVFSKWISLAFAGLFGLYEVYKNKDPGTQGEELEALSENNKETADEIKGNAAAEATKSESDRNSREDTARSLADAYSDTKPREKLPPGEGPPSEFKDLYKWKFSIKECPPCGHYELKDNGDRVNSDTGEKCKNFWCRLRGCCSDGDKTEGDQEHAWREKMGWEKNEKGEWGYGGEPTGSDRFREVASTVFEHHKNARDLNKMSVKEVNDKVAETFKDVEAKYKDAFDRAHDASLTAEDRELAKRALDEFNNAKNAMESLQEDADDAVDDEDADGEREAGEGMDGLAEGARK